MTKSQRTSVARLLGSIVYYGGHGSARYTVATYERMRDAGFAVSVPGKGWNVTEAGHAFLKASVSEGLCNDRGVRP